RPAVGRAGLGVPALELAHAAVEPDHEHLALLRLEGPRDVRREEAAGGPRHQAEHLAPRDRVVVAAAGVAHQWFILNSVDAISAQASSPSAASRRFPFRSRWAATSFRSAASGIRVRMLR